MSLRWLRALLIVAVVLGTCAWGEGLPRGGVDEVDLRANQVRMEDGTVLQLTRTPVIVRNDAEVSLEAVEPGDEVRARYDDESGAVRRLDVRSPDELSASDPGWDGPRQR